MEEKERSLIDSICKDYSINNNNNKQQTKNFSFGKLIKRILIAITFGIGVYFITTNIFGCYIKYSYINKDNYFAIEYGMSYMEVYYILDSNEGEITSQTVEGYHTTTYITWANHNNSKYIRIGFKYDNDGILDDYKFGTVSYKTQYGLY